MKLGKVVGTVWATKKDENLNGQKLLVLRMLRCSDQMSKELLVGADFVGAGVGDIVLLSGGNAARCFGNHAAVPIDLAIVGIVDSIEMAK